MTCISLFKGDNYAMMNTLLEIISVKVNYTACLT